MLSVQTLYSYINIRPNLLRYIYLIEWSSISGIQELPSVTAISTYSKIFLLYKYSEIPLKWLLTSSYTIDKIFFLIKFNFPDPNSGNFIANCFLKSIQFSLKSYIWSSMNCLFDIKIAFLGSGLYNDSNLHNFCIAV